MTELLIFLGVALLLMVAVTVIRGNANKQEKLLKEQEKQEKRERRKQEKQQWFIDYDKKISDLCSKYGEVTKDMHTSEDYLDLMQRDWTDVAFLEKLAKDRMFVFEQEEVIVIQDKPYKFDDILGFEVYNNSQTIYSGTTSETTTSTNTGSMIGRAAVGGLLFGSVGAVVGGATAKKTTTGQTTSQKATTKNNYDVVLTINSLSVPTLKINFKENQNGVQELVSVLTVIQQRKKEN